jgi:hypothetical protein
MPEPFFADLIISFPSFTCIITHRRKILSPDASAEGGIFHNSPALLS